MNFSVRYAVLRRYDQLVTESGLGGKKKSVFVFVFFFETYHFSFLTLEELSIANWTNWIELLDLFCSVD